MIFNMPDRMECGAAWQMGSPSFLLLNTGRLGADRSGQAMAAAVNFGPVTSRLHDDFAAQTSGASLCGNWRRLET